MRLVAVPFVLSLVLGSAGLSAQEAAQEAAQGGAAEAPQPQVSPESFGLDIGHCAFPQTPVIPDGTVAVESDLAAAGGAVKTFVANIQAALGCLEAKEKDLGGGITAEQRGAINAIYNAGVDEMNAVAAQYNAAVRAFKARSAE